MIVVSMCTIPVRKKSFKQVVHRILDEQTQPVDKLHVWLNGYQQIDADLPQDDRLIYHLEPDNPGPWVRYRVADSETDAEFLVTLDDDNIYPKDYIEQGLIRLRELGPGKAVCFSGIVWGPLMTDYEYGSNRSLYLAVEKLSYNRRVALHMGQTGFFWRKELENVIVHALMGFKTNDDMMIGWQLQQRNIDIICCPKPKEWIQCMPAAKDENALWRMDRNTRKDTFKEMITKLNFDPTAAMLSNILKKPKRLLVLSAISPPLAGSESLDKYLQERSREEGVSVHLLTLVPASNLGEVNHHVDIPYMIHTVAIPQAKGRFENIVFVRSWRYWRNHQQVKKEWLSRLKQAITRLKPTEIIKYDGENFICVDLNTDYADLQIY